MQKDLEKLISLDLNLKFDADGNIENYKQALSGLMGEDLKKAQKAIENYRGSLSTYASVQDEIIDNNYELEDSKLEEIDLEVNLKIQAADFTLENIERLLDRLENKAFDAASAISLMGDQLAPTMQKIEGANKGIEDIFEKNGLTKYLNDPEGFRKAIEAGQVSLTETEIEKLREYYTTMEEGQDALLEIQSQVYDMLIEAMEEFNNKLKEQSEILEHQSSILEQYENIIDLIGKKNLGINNDILKEISKVQTELATGQLAEAKARRDTTQSDLDTARKLLAEEKAKGDDADATTVKKLEETVKAAEDAAKEAETNFMTSWVNALEAAADAFEKSINRIAEEFSKSVSGIYGSIEEMRAAFDRQQEVSKRFLADYEKTYEISKLNRNITNQIDNTKNVKAQKQLAELASEINAYAIEGREMSKIDLEYMQKKYDLMVAQIALEEAQNAKNQVRLTRDSSGNWGYVYTANEQATDKAQQTLEDKRYAMEQFMHNTEYELTNEMIALNEEYQQGIAELAEKYGTDSERFKQESERLTQQYKEDLNYIMTEYEEMTERGATAVQEWGLQVSDTFEETLIGKIYPTYSNFEDLQQATNNAVVLALGDLQNAYVEFSDELDTIMTTAGTSIEGFASLVAGDGTDDNTGYLGKVKKTLEEVEGAIEALVQAHTNKTDGLPAANTSLDVWKTKWEETARALNRLDFTAIKTNLSSIYELYNKINSSSIKAPSTMSNYKWTEDTYTDNNGMTWRKFYNTETNEEYWIDEEKVSSYGDGSGKGQFSMSGSDMNIQTREGTIKSNDAMIDQQEEEKNYLQSGSGSYIKMSELDKTIGDTTYYAYSEVLNNGSLGKTRYITNLNNATSTGEKANLNEDTESNYMLSAPESYTLKLGSSIDEQSLKSLQKQDAQTLESIPYNYIIKKYWDNAGTEYTNYYVLDDKMIAQSKLPEGSKVEAGQLKIPKGEMRRFEARQEKNPGFWYSKLYIDKDATGDVETTYSYYGDPSYSFTKATPKVQAYEWGESSSKVKQVWNQTWTIGKSAARVDFNKAYGFNQAVINNKDELYYQINNDEQGTSEGSWFKMADLDKFMYSSFDTGGYTGDWGPEGKLAVLHQKEIILNAQDTENFLTAIQIVRSLSDKLERNALLANQGLGNIIASSNLSLGGDTLEQHVTITAEFPNVVDHNEIQEAFNTLVNQASQYANR